LVLPAVSVNSYLQTVNSFGSWWRNFAGVISEKLAIRRSQHSQVYRQSVTDGFFTPAGPNMLAKLHSLVTLKYTGIAVALGAYAAPHVTPCFG